MVKNIIFLKNTSNHMNSTFFPVQQHKGKKRSFQIKWLTEFQWFVFSPKTQGGFCIACALFAKEEERKHLGQLVNKPFVNWKNKNEILPQHNEKSYNCKTVNLAKMFATGIEKSWHQFNLV